MKSKREDEKKPNNYLLSMNDLLLNIINKENMEEIMNFVLKEKDIND